MRIIGFLFFLTTSFAAFGQDVIENPLDVAKVPLSEDPNLKDTDDGIEGVASFGPFQIHQMTLPKREPKKFTRENGNSTAN